MQYRNSLPRTSKIVVHALPSWLLMVFLGLVAFGVSNILQPNVIGAIPLGMVIGSVLRDFGSIRRFRKNWPIQSRVTDWEAVIGLLAADAAARGAAATTQPGAPTPTA